MRSPNEGHGFARLEHRLSFNTVVEAFLSRHPDGLVEPVGREFEGFTITVLMRAEEVPDVGATLTLR